MPVKREPQPCGFFLFPGTMKLDVRNAAKVVGYTILTCKWHWLG